MFRQLHFAFTILSFLCLFTVSRAWRLIQKYDATNWAESFNVEQTNANFEYVNFLSLVEAATRRLIYAENNALILKVDSSAVLDATRSRGRDSVRIRSKRAFTHGLFVADIDHMPPQVCGLWPSFFLIGNAWPQDGEIDVIEGVNLMPQNQVTIHSRPGCAPRVGERGEKGRRTGEADCGAGNGAVGCGVYNTAESGYGAGLNRAGGAVYALLWAADGIQVWQWPRRSAPRDALGGGNPNPARWGKPVANWGAGCRFDDAFKNLNLVFATTFCGGWAGRVWDQSPCKAKAPTCQQYVAANPKAFADAYWKIRSVKVFDK